ncbi:pilus assembly protein [bacterium]|nr:pilus assembly protein [bacterium]
MNMFRNKSKAQATLEFSLVVGVFLLMFFGFIELARYITTKYVITNAAREGARMVSKMDQLKSVEEKQEILEATVIGFGSGLKADRFSTMTFNEIEKDGSNFVQIDLVYNETTITPLGKLWGLVGLPMAEGGDSFAISTVIQEKLETATTKMCTNCGITVPGEANYCPNCGTGL